MSEAVAYNRRSWRYVSRILENWAGGGTAGRRVLIQSIATKRSAASTGPSTMKRIGDVMREIPIRPPSNPPGIVISNRETVKCPICKDAGLPARRLPGRSSHVWPDRPLPRASKRKSTNGQAERLRRLSNLDKFATIDFEEFDPPSTGPRRPTMRRWSSPGSLVIAGSSSTGPCGTRQDPPGRCRRHRLPGAAQHVGVLRGSPRPARSPPRDVRPGSRRGL